MSLNYATIRCEVCGVPWPDHEVDSPQCSNGRLKDHYRDRLVKDMPSWTRSEKATLKINGYDGPLITPTSSSSPGRSTEPGAGTAVTTKTATATTKK